MTESLGWSVGIFGQPPERPDLPKPIQACRRLSSYAPKTPAGTQRSSHGNSDVPRRLPVWQAPDAKAFAIRRDCGAVVERCLALQAD